MEYAKYLNQVIHCSCGREHICGIHEIIVEAGAAEKTAVLAGEYGYQKCALVMDLHTKKAAGEKVCAAFQREGIPYEEILFEKEELVPDEWAIGRLFALIGPENDAIIAIGSGVINDLCKFAAARLGIEYIIVATAPSMDGYASNVSPLIIKNTKTTYEAVLPKAILADTDILKKAPKDMILAGVGDVLGKYLCLMDWNLSNIVNGEYHCSYVEKLVQASIQKVMEGAEQLKSGSGESIASVMEGLLLSGICMSYIGNSRPASGSEHHLAHYWEMQALQKKTFDAFHGTKVAVGTVAALKIYEMLSEMEWEKLPERKPFDMEKWTAEIRSAYGSACDTVITLEKQVHKNADEAVRARRMSLLQKKEELMRLIKALPSSADIRSLLSEIGAPYTTEQIQVEEEILRDSIYYAKDLRNRYGLLQLLYDLGIQEEAFQCCREIMRADE